MEKKRGGDRGGRKPPGPTTDNPRKNKSIKFTDVEWAEVKARAKTRGLNASEHVRMESLRAEGQSEAKALDGPEGDSGSMLGGNSPH